MSEERTPMEHQLSNMNIDTVVLGDVTDSLERCGASTYVEGAEEMDVCSVAEVSIRLSKSFEFFDGRVQDYVVEYDVLNFGREIGEGQT